MLKRTVQAKTSRHRSSQETSAATNRRTRTVQDHACLKSSPTTSGSSQLTYNVLPITLLTMMVGNPRLSSLATTGHLLNHLAPGPIYPLMLGSRLPDNMLYASHKSSLTANRVLPPIASPRECHYCQQCFVFDTSPYFLINFNSLFNSFAVLRMASPQGQ